MQGDSGPAQAEPQTAKLAELRTALSLDRTLLAWIRTSITFIGFGFTLARVVHDLIQKGFLISVNPDYPRHLGFALIALGLLSLMAGCWEHIKLAKQLPAVRSIWSVSLVTSIALITLTLMMLLALVTDLHSPLS